MKGCCFTKPRALLSVLDNPPTNHPSGIVDLTTILEINYKWVETEFRGKKRREKSMKKKEINQKKTEKGIVLRK